MQNCSTQEMEEDHRQKHVINYYLKYCTVNVDSFNVHNITMENCNNNIPVARLSFLFSPPLLTLCSYNIDQLLSEALIDTRPRTVRTHITFFFVVGLVVVSCLVFVVFNSPLLCGIGERIWLIRTLAIPFVPPRTQIVIHVFSNNAATYSYHISMKSDRLFRRSDIAPPNCKNVFGTWKLKQDQNLCPSGTNIDPIFSQHTHLANSSMSPGWKKMLCGSPIRNFIPRAALGCQYIKNG